MFAYTYGYSAARMRRVEDFGERLRALRQSRGLDQIDLAPSDLDHDQRRSFGRYVSRLETGRETNPSLFKLEQLAKGCQFELLSEFVRHLESVEKNTVAKTYAVTAKSDKQSLREAGISTEVGTHGHIDSAISEDDVRRLVREETARYLKPVRRRRAGTLRGKTAHPESHKARSRKSGA